MQTRTLLIKLGHVITLSKSFSKALEVTCIFLSFLLPLEKQIEIKQTNKQTKSSLLSLKHN